MYIISIGYMALEWGGVEISDKVAESADQDHPARMCKLILLCPLHLLMHCHERSARLWLTVCIFLTSNVNPRVMTKKKLLSDHFISTYAHTMHARCLDRKMIKNFTCPKYYHMQTTIQM